MPFDPTLPVTDSEITSARLWPCAAPSRCQEAFDLDVLVHERPVDAEAVANQFPFGALFGRGVQQPGKPLQRGRDFPAIGEQHEDRVLGEADIVRRRFKLLGQTDSE